MSGPLRSKHGCWTCRLRKKKCDELRPQCETCISLAITCYGFGPKPEWMDSTEQKRIVANNLAEMARNHSASRKSTSRPSRESGRFSKLAPKPVDNSSPSGVGSQPDEGLTKDTPLTSKPNNGDHGASVKPPKINPTEEDYVLLMHFLDSVFALQLPLYKPDVADGGRGWLLSMILRTEPLYHAVLAISAYHRRILMPPERIRGLGMENFQYQADHLAVCLAMVHKSTNGSCSKDGSGVAITASIIQLLFLELFTSHSNGWQAHLQVLSRMFQHVHTNELKGIGLCDESRYILLCRKELQNQGIDVRDEVVGFRTFASSVVWLDIIFSVTTGTAPSTWSESLFSEESTCQVQLQDIMGCQNWAMIQIGRVAELYMRKNQATEVNDLECGELIQVAKEIQARIELGLENLGASDRISSGNPALHGATDLDTVVLITYIYAQAALIYLHLVIHGFNSLEDVETPISKVIQSLQNCIKPDSRPALVLPIYICGSVAGGSDRDFIRSVLSNPPLMNPSLQHREKVLQAIEEIWLQRQTKSLYTWTDLLTSSSNILLH